MLDIFNFPLNCREDLLPWADLWGDAGFPLHCLATRVLFHEKKWPAKHREGFCWTICKGKRFSTKRNEVSELLYFLKASASVNQRRVYKTRSMAFVDLICHMVASLSQKSLETRLT